MAEGPTSHALPRRIFEKNFAPARTQTPHLHQTTTRTVAHRAQSRPKIIFAVLSQALSESDAHFQRGANHSVGAIWMDLRDKPRIGSVHGQTLASAYSWTAHAARIKSAAKKSFHSLS